MITYVLGAPGSGKSSIAEGLTKLLPAHVILDWDFLMRPASILAGTDVREDPNTWPAYRDLIGAVVEAMAQFDVVVLGVCTPDELDDWPIDAWLLLDCSDEERRERLRSRSESEISDAVKDAARYRSLGMTGFDTTGRVLDEVAAEVAQHIQIGGSGSDR